MERLGSWQALASLVVACAVGGCGISPTPSPAGMTTPPTAAPTAAPTASPQPSPASTPAAEASWVAAGTLSIARDQAHAAVLEDGRVLVVGSDNICTPGGAWDESVAAELFDPTTSTWTSTAGLNAPRDDFVAVTLRDGRVLVTGGLTSGDPAEGEFGAYSSTKLYDPSTGRWSAGGLLEVARMGAVGALLDDETVLVAGGAYIDSKQYRVLASAEIYDPETGTWSRTGDLSEAREDATAVTLADGRVLVVGGTGPNSGGDSPFASAEIYDPAAGTWTAAGSLETPREGFSLVSLPDGGALVAGGIAGATGTLSATASAERFDPRTLRWSSTGAMRTAASLRAAIVLGDGRVLLAGGRPGPAGARTQVAAIADAELYNPATGTWSATTPLPVPRERASALGLADGSVLLVGGDDGNFPPETAPSCPQPIAAALRYIPENVASFPKPTPRPAAVGLAMSSVPRASAPPAAAKTAAAAINAFGLDLYRRALADKTLTLARKNVVISPTSIAIALAMARAGAKGETAAQMDAVLRSAGADKLATAMNALDQALTSRSGTFKDGEGNKLDVLLKIANAPFAQRDLPIVQAFLDALASRFGAGLRLVDYKADPEAARRLINAWVKTQTKGRIPELLKKEPPDITTLTRLVLVNAMYLKAPWLNPFDVNDTKPGPFTRADGSRVTVPMMNLVECQGLGICDLPYAKGTGWRAVELPYLGGSLAMTIIVPDNLAAFEKKLTPTLLAQVTGALRTGPPGHEYTVYHVALTMPKFGIETRANLADLLAAAGMPLAFDRLGADFTGIASPPEGPLYISKVIHQANIDVDEKGTEASAATAVVMATGGGPDTESIVFKVDRPFLFVLRDVPTGAVLFMGRVVDPSAR